MHVPVRSKSTVSIPLPDPYFLPKSFIFYTPSPPSRKAAYCFAQCVQP